MRRNIQPLVCKWRGIVALSSFLFFGGAVMAQVPTASFVAGRVEYAFESGLRGIVQADFNGDGRPDIAAVNGDRHNISLLLSTPRGGYTASILNFPEDRLIRPQFLAAADFDGDGKQDLAVTSFPGEGQNNVRLFKGDGAGGFTPLGALRTEKDPRFILASDVDGDGRPDLIVCNSSEGGLTIQVFLGQIGGTFSPPTSYAMNGGEPRYIVAGNFDNDDYADLAIAVSQRQFDIPDRVIVLFGTGGGRLDRRSTILLPPRSQPEGLTAGDFNGDGLTDLAIATTGDRRLYIYHNRPSQPGTFSLRTILGSAEGLNLTTGSIAAGDFNGDGHIDLAVGANDRVAVVIGNAEGLFRPQRIVSYYSGGADPYAIQAADFNGDGKLDLVISNIQAGNITVLYGNGDATFDLLRRVGGRTWAVAAGDFNGDGLLDIATANRESGEVSIWHGDGKGGFTLFQIFPTLGGVAPEAIAVDDFNGDNILDIVTANNDTNNVTVLLGDGKGGFGIPTSHALLADFLSPKAMVLGDFNNDGILDVAVTKVGDMPSSINIFPGTGKGIFRGPLPFATDALGSVAIAAADFDGDGLTDLVTANFNSHTVSLLLRDADNPPPTRLFKPARVYPMPRANPSAIAAADVDGDGCPDVVIGYENTAFDRPPFISVMKGQRSGSTCTGQLGDPIHYEVGLNRASGIIAADFNGDGQLDLAVLHKEHHCISILLGNPTDDSFQLQPGRFGVGLSPTSLILSDFDGDGRPDLAAAGSSSSDFIVLINNTP